LLHGTFYAGAALGLLFPAGNDLTNLYGAGYTTSLDFAEYQGLHLGYQWPSGPAPEVGYETMERAAVVHGGPYGLSYSFMDRDVDGYVEPLYRLALSRRTGLLGGLKIGAAEAFLSDNNFSTRAFKGSALMLAPELRYQILFGGRFGLEFGAEYRVANFSTLSTLSASNGPVLNANGIGNWHLMDSGPALGIGLNVYFRRLVR